MYVPPGFMGSDQDQVCLVLCVVVLEVVRIQIVYCRIM